MPLVRQSILSVYEFVPDGGPPTGRTSRPGGRIGPNLVLRGVVRAPGRNGEVAAHGSVHVTRRSSTLRQFDMPAHIIPRKLGCIPSLGTMGSTNTRGLLWAYWYGFRLLGTRSVASAGSRVRNRPKDGS